MREIKEYIRNKKNSDNVIGLDIGGELKHYPILSFDYDITYHRSINHLYPSSSQLRINTTNIDLIHLLSNNSSKITIIINNRVFHGCFTTSYSLSSDDIKEFIISVDYLQIN